MAAGLALRAATLGRRTLVCDLDARGDVAAAFEAAPLGFEARELRPSLWGLSVDTQAALREYLALQLRLPLLARIGSVARAFDFVATAAPGVREVLTVGKVCWEVRQRRWDLVVVDAAATGHVVSQLASPQVLNGLVEVGAIRRQTAWMRELLADPATTGAVVVAAPEPVAVGETVDLVARLGAETEVDVAAVVVNRGLPELFGRQEEAVFTALRAPAGRAALAAVVGAPVDVVLDAAAGAVARRRARAAVAASLRAALPPSVPTLHLPHLFAGAEGLRGTGAVAEALGAELED